MRNETSCNMASKSGLSILFPNYLSFLLCFSVHKLLPT